jgi:outer membrane lipoprotein-sorting protein
MKWAFLFGILVICGGCSSQKPTDSVVGKYVGWQIVNGEASVADGSQGITEKLELKADGTFHYQLNSNVMVSIAAQADGTYKHVGNEVNLTGTLRGTADDGYKKSDEDRPYILKTSFQNGSLVEKGNSTVEHYFRKVGTGSPTLPGKYKLKEADSSAVELLKGVEKVYASMKSFTATGTLESKGAGFAPKKAKFKVLYQSPSNFRFEASALDGNTEYDRTEITWSGGENCWWYTKEFGENTNRPLGNALGIIGVSFGSEADFLPRLLLPNQLGGASLTKRYPEISFLPNETLNGQICMVFQMRSKGANITKLWVAESTGLIVRYFNSIRGETITIDSQMDEPIDPKAFNFGKRSLP